MLHTLKLSHVFNKMETGSEIFEEKGARSPKFTLRLEGTEKTTERMGYTKESNFNCHLPWKIESSRSPLL